MDPGSNLQLKVYNSIIREPDDMSPDSLEEMIDNPGEKIHLLIV